MVTSAAAAESEKHKINATIFRILLLQELFQSLNSFGGTLESANERICNKFVPVGVLINSSVDDGSPR